MKRLFCGAIASLLGCASTTAGDVIVVEVGESIQAALDAAGPDDIVELAPGTHVIETPLNVSDVTLRGANAIDDVDDSVVDAQRLSRHMTLRGSSTVESIHFKNGMTGWLGYEPDPDWKGTGWYGDPDGDPRDWIRNPNNIAWSPGESGGSIRVSDSCNPTTESAVRGCRFSGCRAWLGGVVNQSSDTCFGCGGSEDRTPLASFTDCTFHDNAATYGTIAYTCFHGLSFRNSRIHANRGTHLFRLTWTLCPLSLEGTRICLDDVDGLEFGAFLVSTDTTTCIAADCEDADKDGRPDACADQTNIIQILVEEALAAGSNTVDLPPGRFRLRQPLNVDRLAATGSPDMILRGSPLGETILDGRHSIPIASLEADCRFENLTVANGSNDHGGGIAIIFNLADLEGVTITDCHATSGAAISATAFASIRLNECVIRGCSSPSAIMEAEGAEIATTIFEANELVEDGASLLSLQAGSGTQADPIVRDSTFVMSDAPFATNCFTVEDFTSEDPLTVDRCTFDLQNSPLARIAISDGQSIEAIDSVFLYEGDRRVIFENTTIYATRCEFGGCCPSDRLNFLEEETWPSAYMCPGCEGDYNCDGEIDSRDLGRLLSQWGTTEPRYDYDGDGIARSSDLGRLLSNWGNCP